MITSDLLQQKINNTQNNTLKYFILEDLFKNQNTYPREVELFIVHFGLLDDNAITLEKTGLHTTPQITRERTRQIIQKYINSIANNTYFTKTKKEINKIFEFIQYIPINEIFTIEYFQGFETNINGLVSLLKLLNFKLINYRNVIYLYICGKENLINIIKNKNKQKRKEKTAINNKNKIKTITYIPLEIKNSLENLHSNQNKKLNQLYENILIDFMKKEAYLQPNFTFIKTKSWKSRQGKSNWKQVGLYINSDLFNQIHTLLFYLNKKYIKKISFMSFLCNAFIWHIANQTTENI